MGKMRVLSLCHICTLSVLYISSVVLAGVPEPKNVQLSSYNMDAVLKWDYPRSLSENVTFTAQFRSYFPSEYRTVCSNKTEKRCDFTSLIYHFGTYMFRVRAELQGEVSHWVNTSEFYFDRETVLGPPVLRLHSKEGDMEVTIHDPVLRRSTLKEVYTDIVYKLSYWKEGQEKVKKKMETQQNRQLLVDLQPWNQYCFQAQVYIPVYEKDGEPSEVVCERTVSNGKVQPWLVAIVLIVSFLVVTVVMLLLSLFGWFIYKVLRSFYPSAKLPEHFKRYLMEQSRTCTFLAMQNHPQEKEVHHAIVIVSEGLSEQARATEEAKGAQEESDTEVELLNDQLSHPA